MTLQMDSVSHKLKQKQVGIRHKYPLDYDRNFKDTS